MKNIFLFVNDVKTTEPMNMGLRPYDAKSFVDGRRLFFLFHIPFPILFLINFHSYITNTSVTVAMETYVVFLF